MSLPIIALSMGDAAGIGPELIAKVVSKPSIHELCRPFVVGDPHVMEEACRIAQVPLAVRPIGGLSEARFDPHELEVFCPPGVHIADVRWGQLDAAFGEAGAVCLRTAYELAMQGLVQGVVSAPLNKEAFHLAGYDYSDELVYLAEVTGSRDTMMMGVMDRLYTMVLAEHIPFRDIPACITQERVLKTIRQMDGVLKRAKSPEGRVAVAALNVHAGEGGLYGREEIDAIAPAIAQARVEGIHVQGPVPADMVFVLALEGRFDGVVCMYHDQANIARKLQPKDKGATIFLGLPVVCGTTAHGTAFDIAGRGIADPGSLECALRSVIRLA